MVRCGNCNKEHLANMHNYNIAKKKKKTGQNVQSYGEKKSMEVKFENVLNLVEKMSKFPSVQTSTFCRKGGSPDKRSKNLRLLCLILILECSQVK